MYDEEQMRERLDTWASDVAVMSSPKLMMSDPGYSELLAASDPKRLEWELIERLRAGDLHACYMVMLRRLCNFNPVRRENEGRIKCMASDWIEWYDDKRRYAAIRYAESGEAPQEQKEAHGAENEGGVP